MVRIVCAAVTWLIIQLQGGLQSAHSQSGQLELLPRETVAAISIIDSEQWRNRWESTSLAKFFDSPAVREYLATVSRGGQSEAAWLRIILPGDDPVQITGQLTYALIATGTGFEHLVQLQCHDSNAAANWIAAMSARLEQQQFTAESKTDSIQEYRSRSGDSTVALSAKGNTGLACTRAAVLNQLLSTQFQPLVGSAAFQATVDKARQDTDEALFWWFARPIELTLRDPNDRQAVENFQLVKSQGFDAVQAVGGVGTIDAKTNRVTSIGYAAIDQPLRLAARLLDFNDAAVPAIPAWCRTATSCGFINLKTSQFLEHYSTLFDALYGEGETGVFAAVLDDLSQRQDGPRVDLQQELIRFLDQRVFFATVQGQTTSPRVIGIPVSAPDRVAEAVNKLFAGDSRAVNQSGSGHTTWKIMPLEDGYGIKQPFVISIRERVLFIAPNSSVLDYLLQDPGSSAATFQPNVAIAKMGYRINFDLFASRLFAQLKSKQLSESSDSLLTRLRLKHAILAADATMLPDFESVRDTFNSTLNVVGVGQNNGWKFIIESR